MEDKRHTMWDEMRGCWVIKDGKSGDIGYCDSSESVYVGETVDRLAELEDKIEQGTLVEFPRMFKAIDRTGWIVEFIDESGCVCRNHYFHEERAIKRLKELQNG